MPFANLLKNQEGDEQVIIVVHRHWFDILVQYMFVFLLLLALVASYFFLPLLFPGADRTILSKLIFFGENLFLMLIWAISGLIWIDYYFDVWIITNKRIVNAEQKGLFSREVSELKLEKIQDVSTEVLGIIPTFLNYGDVEVQTAGEEQKFLFRRVPDPYSIKDLIMNLQKRKERASMDQFEKELKEKIHSGV